MLSRGNLTDDEWAVPEPLLPASNNRCGRWRDHRQVINGIIRRLSTGCQWRQLPERSGPWQTVHKRHMLWPADGTWERLLQHVQAVAGTAGHIDWNINVDSTVVRAHQHAAGAPTAPPPTLRNASKGAAQRSVHVRADVPQPDDEAGHDEHRQRAGAIRQDPPSAADWPRAPGLPIRVTGRRLTRRCRPGRRHYPGAWRVIAIRRHPSSRR